jgi:hypothetical protein
MSEPRINVPNPDVLRAGIAHAEADIEHWNQNDWVKVGDRLPDEQGGCGTTACLAGHILLAQGYSWKELATVGDMSSKALRALGWLRPGVFWEDDAQAFYDYVFCHTKDEGDDILAFTPERMSYFKQWITELTGVTFDE